VQTHHRAPSAAMTDADLYDTWFDRPWGRYAFTVEAAAVIGALPEHMEGIRVLDAGCGTGRFSAVLRRTGAAVVGVDLDPDMLAVAAHRLAGCCARAAAEVLPFPAAAFDVTVAVTLLEFVDQPAAVTAELARVTHPGGRVIVAALNPRSPWGIANRRRLQSGVWCDARFLTRADLRALGAPHGHTDIRSALFAPDAIPALPVIGPLLEKIGRLAPALGAFQVLTIQKEAA
jgi:SAM-dependent methyltransferase